jgi:hypothetical protein
VPEPPPVASESNPHAWLKISFEVKHGPDVSSCLTCSLSTVIVLEVASRVLSSPGKIHGVQGLNTVLEAWLPVRFLFSLPFPRHPLWF